MGELDPRIAEIMAKLNKEPDTDEKKKQEVVETKEVKAPTTFEEFLDAESLIEWPQHLTSENPLEFSEERELYGNQIMIENELKSATPIDLQVLRDLEYRLNEFDATLYKYGNMILNLDQKGPFAIEEGTTSSLAIENLPISVPKAITSDKVQEVDIDPVLDATAQLPSRVSWADELAPKVEPDSIDATDVQLPSGVTLAEDHASDVEPAFLTEMAESDAVKAHPSRKKKELLASKESLDESRKKTVEYCTFPGFRVGELTELPGQLEAPHILHRVSKAQDFKPGFRKFWKKIFLSEASVAIMQDTFWWIFLENFARNHVEPQSKLFDRIADSFVALFFSVNPEIKDKVFLVYADCLAQCIYAAFYEAFPESLKHFQESFKQYLVEVTTTWISGIKPLPNATKHWNIKRMLPKHLKNSDDKAVQARREITVKGPVVPPKLDVDEFVKQVDHLGQPENQKPQISKAAMAIIQGVQTHSNMLSREQTKLTNQTTTGGNSYFPTVTASRMPQVGSPRPPLESHVIGPGAEVERVRFNLKGRSPLVAHYLYMRELRDNKPHGGKILHRTELGKAPDSNQPTYRDLIRETLKVQETLSKEYQKVCEDTNQEILKIERKQRDTNKKIQKLQNKLMDCKSSMEVKIMSERILDKQDLDASLLSMKEDEE